MWTFSPFISVGLHIFSTRITRGKLCVEEIARVVRESTCVFLLLGICCKEKDSNLNYKCLTCFKYSCILKSLASNSPFIWLTTNLEFENTSTIFPPIFWTIAIPINKASYSASLFVAKKPNLKDFLMMILSEDTTTNPLQIPFDLMHHQHIPSKIEVFVRRSSQLIFYPCSTSRHFLLSEARQTRPPNPQEPRPFIEVRGIYLILKDPRIVAHFAILPV